MVGGAARRLARNVMLVMQLHWVAEQASARDAGGCLFGDREIKEWPKVVYERY